MPAEEWRPVPSFSGYIASSLGRVRRDAPDAPFLKGAIDKDGYRTVGLHGCTVRVHCVVAETFHGPRPDGFQCAHLDGDCTNNAADNLAWVTPKENSYHKKLHGRPNGGFKEFWKGRKPVLSEATLHEIRQSPLSSRKAAEQFGVSQCHVVRIRNGTRRAIAGPSRRFLSLTRNPDLEPPERFLATVKKPGDIIL